ncbi:hypothetical protein EVAR_99088_1 [Eumeta japonica]|uniref:Uncharacterized protein n=1 Tax=Eumeta variegata TaxID=151549 RepID=A0A4C1ZM77_EUMVA|nr:hypothetical protein EVAR_99088_1 [Eumeta japonica]
MNHILIRFAFSRRLKLYSASAPARRDAPVFPQRTPTLEVGGAGASRRLLGYEANEVPYLKRKKLNPYRITLLSVRPSVNQDPFSQERVERRKTLTPRRTSPN